MTKIAGYLSIISGVSERVFLEEVWDIHKGVQGILLALCSGIRAGHVRWGYRAG